VNKNPKDLLDTIKKFSQLLSQLITDKLSLLVLKEKLNYSTHSENANIPVKKVTTTIGSVKLDSVLLTRVKVPVFNPTLSVLVGTDGSKSGTLVSL